MLKLWDFSDRAAGSKPRRQSQLENESPVNIITRF